MADPPIIELEDVCECGDYRRDHDFSGACKVCRDSPAPWNGCKRFRLDPVATKLVQRILHRTPHIHGDSEEGQGQQDGERD